jgi:hypothetical protein
MNTPEHDLLIAVVLQAMRDACTRNGHAASARDFLDDDAWVVLLGVTPKNAERIRAHESNYRDLDRLPQLPSGWWKSH